MRDSPTTRRSRTAIGAVLCEAPTTRTSVTQGLHALALRLGLGLLLQLAQLALDPGELPGHDRNVDQHEGEEHDVGRRDVIPPGVRGEGHRCWGAALRGAAAGRSSSSPVSLRRRARSCIEACLEVSSYFHSVTASTAMATSETRKVRRISPGRSPPEALSTRGCVLASWAKRTAMKFTGTQAPAMIENTAA